MKKINISKQKLNQIECLTGMRKILDESIHLALKYWIVKLQVVLSNKPYREK